MPPMRSLSLFVDLRGHFQLGLEMYAMAREMIASEQLPADVLVGKTSEIIQASRCTMSCSGSVSLELLYFTTPSPRDFNPSTGVEGFLTHEITLSHDHGFYDASFAEGYEAERFPLTRGTEVR